MNNVQRRSAQFVPLAAILPMLALMAGSLSAQTPATSRTVSGPVSGSPCDVVAGGGTVFDTRECDLLRSTGVVPRSGQWIALAGRTLNLQVVSKDPKMARSNLAVGVVRPGERAPVVQTRTGADGALRLALPANLNGEFHLLSLSPSGAAEPAELWICNGNGYCVEFCELPSDPATLTPMCVEDSSLPTMRVVAPGGPGRR
ncbi:MAG TPA: hypothetical protein VGB66_10705 [Longimicrobium sp.]|jgi:hypothetical protein